jgi:hypothetical protein
MHRRGNALSLMSLTCDDASDIVFGSLMYATHPCDVLAGAVLGGKHIHHNLGHETGIVFCIEALFPCVRGFHAFGR